MADLVRVLESFARKKAQEGRCGGPRYMKLNNEIYTRIRHPIHRKMLKMPQTKYRQYYHTREPPVS